jgi:hypothetical protein
MSDEFMQMITRSVAQPVLPSTPPRRKIRTKQLDMQSTPRRSSRLAKKACNCVLAVVEAQNVLMRKLGLAQSQHLESRDFKSYLKLFKEGAL